MNAEWKDGPVCLCHSSGLGIGVHDKNIHIILGKANNNTTTTKKRYMSSYFGEK